MEKYLISSTTPTIGITDLNLSVNETFQWIFSGLNVNVSRCSIDSVSVVVQPSKESNHTEQILENPQIIIHNSTFSSLDLKPGTKAQITECYIDAEFKPRPTLITADNSYVTIKNCHFGNFINENDSTILDAHSISNVAIENSIFIKHSSSKGILLLKNISSINISDSFISHIIALTPGYSAVTLRHAIQAVVNNTAFRNNSALVGGALYADEQCQVTLTYCTFCANKAITGKTMNISKKSNLQKGLQTLDGNNNGTHKPIRSTLFNQTSSDSKHSKTISAQHAKPHKRSLITKTKPAHLLVRGYHTTNHSDQQDGSSLGSGGAIFAWGECQILVRNCIIKDNSAQYVGGAIVTALNVKLDIEETTFVGNKALYDGGAIDVQQQAQLRITNCVFGDNVSQQVLGGVICGGGNITLDIQETTFVGNKALRQGGAISVQQQAQLRIINCVFDDNVSQLGGAIFGGNNNITLDIHDTTFLGNKAFQGGALNVDHQAQLRITNCVFDENVSEQLGGAICVGPNIILDIQETTFVGNKAAQGGAIDVDHQVHIRITNCIFDNNLSQGNGGVIEGLAYVTLDIQGTNFTRNTAHQGGVIDLQIQSYLRMTDCTFKDNRAELHGGAISGSHETVLEINTSYFFNSSSIEGGAISVQQQASLFIANCRLEGNFASGDGGAITAINKATLTIRETNFTGNSAFNGGALSVSFQSKGHVEWCVFHNNTVELMGGAVQLYTKALLQIENTNFTSNNSTEGGAISIRSNSELQTQMCNFGKNFAKQDGGAINLDDKSRAVIEYCYFLSNQAMNGQGGAMALNNLEHVSVRGTLLLRNVASDSGGAVSITNGPYVTMNNITCIGNQSPNGGGCLYIDSVTLTLNNSDISENVGLHMGAGILASDSRIQVGNWQRPTDMELSGHLKKKKISHRLNTFKGTSFLA